MLSGKPHFFGLVGEVSPPTPLFACGKYASPPSPLPPGPLSSGEGEKRVTRGLVSKSHRAINQIPEGGYKKGDPLGRP